MSATRRLFLEDPSLVRLEVSVLETRPDGDAWLVRTDATLLAPEGGGQPEDRGTLAGLPVLGVVERDGDLWHRLAAPPPEGPVLIELDAARRLDTSQQHTGQHVLSAVLWRELRVRTLSFHLGAEDVTVDVERPSPLAPAELERVEVAANAAARAGLAVTARLARPEELPGLGLRKPPTVSGDVRVVSIAGLDAVACCGTHLASTAGAAPLLVLSQERMRGNLRLHFVCGARAEVAARRQRDVLAQAAARLNVPPLQVAERCAQSQDRLEALERAQSELRERFFVQALVERAATDGRRCGAATVVAWWAEELGASEAARVASAFCNRPGRVAFVGAPSGERATVVACCSSDVALPCHELLVQAVTAAGGKGGGSPRRAQGSAPAAAASDVLARLAALAAERLGA